MRWRPPQLNDDEFVENIRKLVDRTDRDRPGATTNIVVWFLVVCGSLILLSAIQAPLPGNPNGPQIWAGFIAGITVGATMVRALIEAISHVFQLHSGLRTERLLLRYYDAFHQSLGNISIEAGSPDLPSD